MLMTAGFRRTLVGLKPVQDVVRLLLGSFQTNPCGVEAAGAPVLELVDDGFRRTLVGLKPPDAAGGV